MWRDIACIVFVCVTVNHLGLISAIESAIRRKLWIVDCPKCLTFWATLCYQLVTDCHQLPQMLAISFLASYAAIWLELAEGFIDHLYNYIYGKIYPTADTTDADAERA